MNLKKIHNEIISLKDIRFHHCASICPHGNGVLICFYAGSRECGPDQAVRVIYFDNKYHKEMSMENGSGNPVIWRSGDEAILLYSIFERETSNPVQKWMYCSNWLERISVNNNKPVRVGKRVKLPTAPSLGYLGRCQPIQYKDKTLVPIYREHDCYGSVYEGSGLSYMQKGIIGQSTNRTGNRFGSGLLIQPTIWHDGEKLYSLSRDITKKCHAWFSESEDDGKTWTKPEGTEIANYNNSVTAIHDGSKYPKIIWNHTDLEFMQKKMLNSYRYCMMLGQLKEDMTVEPIEQLNTSMSASYPNYCFDAEGKLHIVHSDYPIIRHHIYDVIK